MLRHVPLGRSGAVAAIEIARPAVHYAVQGLLASALSGLSQAEFQSHADDPFHEPNDRLIASLGQHVIGHVRFTKRELRFGSVTLPVAGVHDLLVMPEYRRCGLGSQILAAGEKELRADATLFAITRTSHPAFYLANGWFPWTRHSYSRAGAREILSSLLVDSRPRLSFFETPPTRFNIRLWRHVEERALIRLYEQNTVGMFGPYARTDAYWRWLINRRGQDRIYVALDGPDRDDVVATTAAIQGYAAVRGGRILEMMSAPESNDVERQLLTRICSDAIENGCHDVRLDAPQGNSLHSLFVAAGGNVVHHEAVHGEVCLVKLLDWDRTVKAMGSLLWNRFRQGMKMASADLTLVVDDHRLTLEFRSDSWKAVKTRASRSSLRLSTCDLGQILLGHTDVTGLIKSGKIIASTKLAGELATVLFPRVPLWRSPWDDAPAR